MTTTDTISVLVVEDDELHRELVANYLSISNDARFDIAFAESCAQALDQLATRSFDCMLLDHSLHDGTGDQLLRMARDELISTPVVAISTSVDPEVMLTEFRSGCVDFIAKRDAFREAVLANTITKTVDNHRTRAAVERSQTSAQMIEKAGALLKSADDSTGSKSNEHSITQNLKLIYEVAVQTIQDGVVLVEQRDRVVYANPAFKRLLGLPEDAHLPGHPLTTIDNVMTAEAAGRFRRLTADSSQFESMLRTVDGRSIPVLIGQTPLGESGVVCAITDLSRIKVQQRELERQNRKLVELNDTANRFVDDVSHEFRTPLAVIKGYAEILDQQITGPVNEEQKGFLGTILDRTRDLAQMVDDLLDSSKIRAGCLRVDRRPHHLSTIIASLRPAMVHKAITNNINVRINVSDQLPMIYADDEKVGRVILNLVINGIKFSPEGSDVAIWAKDDGNGTIRIGVTDEGPGISRENLACIFQRFKQIGDPQRSSTKGFGLGLSIASELVAMNLGTMSVDSEPGCGSTFSFTLPIHDPRIIAERFLDNAAALKNLDDSRDSAAAPPLALLCVTPSDQMADLDRLQAFLASHTQTMDVIFEASDRRSLFLFGFSANPKRWMHRLQCEFDEHDDEETGAQSTPRFVLLGTWTSPDENQDAVAALLQRIEAGENIAVQSS